MVAWNQVLTAEKTKREIFYQISFSLDRALNFLRLFGPYNYMTKNVKQVRSICYNYYI